MILRYLLQYRNQIISIGIILVFGIILNNIVSEFSTESKRLKKENNQIKDRKKLLEDWQRINKRNEEVEKNFFRKDTLIFKRFVEEKSQEASINLDYLSPSHDDKSFYSESSIYLKVTAEYKNIAEFIKLLEDRNIKIERLIIRTTSAGRKADISIKGVTLKD